MEDRNGKGQFIEGNRAACANRMQPPAGAAKMVFELTSKGISEVTIGKALGVSYPTWQRWREEYSELTQAWEEGRGIEHDALFSVLFEAATKDGNIVAAMFLLKARHGYKEGEPVGVQNKVAITFQIPGSLSPTEYEAEILRESLPKAKLRRLTDGK